MPHESLQKFAELGVRLILGIDLTLAGCWYLYLLRILFWRRDLKRIESSSGPASGGGRPPRPAPPFAPEWSLTHPFLAIQIVLILTGVLNLPALWMTGEAPRVSLEPWSGPMANAMLYGLFIQNVLLVAAVAFFLKRYRSSLREIGLRTLPVAQFYNAIGLGIAMFFVAGIADAGLSALLHRLMAPETIHALDQWAKEVSAEGIYLRIPGAARKAGLIFAGVALAPVAEEIFFRGFLYRAAARRLRQPAAVLLSAASFALLHLNPLSMGIIFVMGIVLAVAYERTGSLTFTVLVHAVNNGLSFAFLAMMRTHGSP